MVADCKSAGLTPYVGSNPTPTMAVRRNGGTAVGWGGRATKTAESGALTALPAYRLTVRGCSSVGRASAFQAEGRGFESRRPLRGRAYALTHYQRDLTVPAGEWIVPERRIGTAVPPGRVSGMAGYRRTAVARVAQLVERILGKDEVRGSIPRASLMEGRESRV